MIRKTDINRTICIILDKHIFKIFMNAAGNLDPFWYPVQYRTNLLCSYDTLIKIMVEICFCIGTYIICMSAPIFMDSQSRVAFVEIVCMAPRPALFFCLFSTHLERRFSGYLINHSATPLTGL